MKRLLILILVLAVKIAFPISNPHHNSLSGAEVIDNKDTVVFNLSNAIFSSTYVDIPVSFLSDDTVNAIDFSFAFNESILTFDSLINYKASYLYALANFNTADRKLRVTSNSFQRIENNTFVMAVRFLIQNPCAGIKQSYFNTIKVYLNGDPCVFKFTNPVDQTPVAAFANPAPCASANIQFTDVSVMPGGTITAWSWDFGNGNTSASPNPSTVYTSVGNYNVILVVTSNAGCKDTVMKTINVNPSPTTNFAFLSDCKNSSVAFTDNTTISSGTIKSWTWAFGDSNSDTVQNPIHGYAAGGTYTVSLTSVSDSGCATSQTKSITLNSPTAGFSVSNGCSGSTINFTDSSTVSAGTINSWKWYFGDGNTSSQQNPSHIYSVAGTYTVSLKITTDQNCADSISKTISVDNKPVVKFGADILSGCLPLNVNFYDSSLTTAGSIYLWDFGDGDTASLQHAVHNYISSGNYTVKLYIQTPGGCLDSMIRTSYINVGNAPVAKFGISNGCYGTVAVFTDSSTVSAGSINSWQWNFGDGITSTSQNPSHLYTSAGTYTVSLKVMSNQNCSDSISKTIIIGNKPNVKFSGNVLSGCSPLSVVFNDSSITSPGSVYAWDFGDGTVSSLQNATHIYTSAGSYNVKLMVTTITGCSDSLVKMNYITVSGKPVAKFKVSNACLGSTLNFIDSSTISTGSISSWKWNFGDGNASTLQNPAHIYLLAGTYTVSLKVTSSQNCSDSIIKVITIENKPVVKFGSNNITGCSPLTINFSDSSVTAPGASYYWNFGDAGISVFKNPSHTYLSAGNYTVKLKVTTSAGCSDSLIKTSYINVNSTATAQFSAMNGCTGSVINFSDSSKVSSGTITGWTWYFGDGNSSFQQHPSYIYGNAGTYTVSLKITTSQGCSDSVSKAIIIEARPLINFTANNLTGCVPLDVAFLDSSLTAPGSTYRWEFGDSAVSSLKDPIHTYTNTGVYTVKLYVTTPVGCEDSLIKAAYINISDGPTALFTASPKKTKSTDGVVKFHNLSKNIKSSLWNFGDSTLSSHHNPIHKFMQAGIYVVCLTVENKAGCTDTYCDTIIVSDPSIVAIPSAFTPNDDNSNDILRVRGGPLAEMELRIFNEWGNLVFLSTVQDEGWDGTFKGTPQPEGVYEYVLKGKTTDDEIISLHGVVTLVR